MKNSATLIAAALSLVACGGGGGGSSPSQVPMPVPPVTAPPVVVPPVVTPPVVVPPVVVPPVTPPPVVAIVPCAAPTTTQNVVLWDRTEMKVVCNSVYIEPGVPADEELFNRQSVTYANEKITAYYNGVKVSAQPDIILCKTQPCRAFFLGTGGAATVSPGARWAGATYITPRVSTMMIYTSFVNYGRETLVHELAHAEMYARIAGGHGIPQWFDEGQAEAISHSNDCTNYTEKAVADLRTLDSGTAFQAFPKGDAVLNTKLYCQSRREVEAWITANGKDKFIALLAVVKAGTPFYTVYGALLTQ